MGLLPLACIVSDQGFSDRYCPTPERDVPLDEMLPSLPLAGPSPLELKLKPRILFFPLHNSNDASNDGEKNSPKRMIVIA